MIEADARLLAERIQHDFPRSDPLRDRVWRQSAAAKVIDCVLSLRKKYDTVVVPRVQRFVREHNTIVSCGDLKSVIVAQGSPEAFIESALNMRSPRKGRMIAGVTDYLLDIQDRFVGENEDSRLNQWALWARPGDFLSLDIPNFGLAGFQYLRMLFGADTVKPDVHILKYVEQVVGRRVADRVPGQVQAVYALERAGQLLGRSIREIDVSIWERGSGRRLPA